MIVIYVIEKVCTLLRVCLVCETLQIRICSAVVGNSSLATVSPWPTALFDTALSHKCAINYVFSVSSYEKLIIMSEVLNYMVFLMRCFNAEH